MTISSTDKGETIPGVVSHEIVITTDDFGFVTDAKIDGTRYVPQLETDVGTLLAAAPDLLAVVERIDYFRDALIQCEYQPGSGTITELVDAARAAIAKAKGGNNVTTPN